MSLVLLACATGSPGVTTTALGLALHWPRDVLLVDADRVPSQAIEAGHLGAVSTQGRGLMALAQAHREGRELAAAAWDLAVPLPGSGERQRRFLSGFSHPGAAELFNPLWNPVAQALSQLDGSAVDVIVDLGRVGTGLPAAVVENADVALMVTRSTLRALAALRLHLPSFADAVDLAAPRAQRGLIVIGPGQPYDAKEIGEHFGVAVATTLPDEPKLAAVLSDGAPAPRKFDQSSLTKAFAAAALQLTWGMSRRSDRGVPQRVGQ